MNLGQIIKPNKKWLIASVLLISACAGVASGGITTPSGEQNVEEAQIEPTSIVTNTPENNTVTNPPETAVPPSIPKVLPDLLPDELPPLGADGQFTTDFSRHTVLYSDILSGGPPKDGIPAIDKPTFTSVQVADEYLQDLEPVVFLQIGEDARAYPLQILIWHDIVNDIVDGKPVAVTFCPDRKSVV